MNVSLFTFVDLYTRQLTSVGHLLGKGAEFAGAQGLAPDAILEWRLIDDMHPLRFQAAVVCNFSRAWMARVIGAEAPTDFDFMALDLAGFHAAVAESKAWLAALRPDQFAGREDIPLTVRITDTLEPTMPAAQWLTVFATTNIYFHLSMVYAILRQHGVPIGKADLFAGVL
jgi:hypothetical protein